MHMPFRARPYLGCAYLSLGDSVASLSAAASRCQTPGALRGPQALARWASATLAAGLQNAATLGVSGL
jgi:hypothetical protein